MNYSMHSGHVRELLGQALSHADHEDRGLADDADDAVHDLGVRR